MLNLKKWLKSLSLRLKNTSKALEAILDVDKRISIRTEKFSNMGN